MYNNDTERLFAEGGMNDEGGTVDPVSGNDVPPGSLQNEVRDDIDVKISEGEFVIPADVVRYIGLERLMKLRDEAKQGLSRMAEIGQMGNAQEVANPEALQEEDGFDSEIDDIMKEVDGEQMGEKNFNAGGFAVPGIDLLDKYNIPKTSITNPALDVRAYKNKDGRVMYITFFNDKPSIQIPAGYEFAGTAGQFIAETKKTDDKKEVVTATGTVDTSGGGGDGVSVGGGPSVGGSGPGTGTGIGNSAIGIAIGAVANAISSVTNALGITSPNTNVAETSMTGIGNTGATAEGLAANAAALGVDDASTSEGVSEGTSSNGAPGTVGSTDATAAADNSGNTNSGDGGGGSGSTGGGAGAGTGNAMAKGGLVAKRTKKPTPAKKRGIASKK